MTIIRLGAHFMLLGWSTAIAILLFLARGKTVRVMHFPIALIGLICFNLWLLGLLVSVRSTALIPREILVTSLGLLELATAVAAWSWLLLSVKYSFRFQLRKAPPLADSR